MKKYDIIVYGATGFTGKRAAAYMQKNAGIDIKWAIAGRNQEKLQKVKDDLHLTQDVIVADALNESQIEKMVQQTNIVLTTAGPYALHGTNLIAACAKQGVHYVDITGEAPWVRDMLDKYGAKAKDSKAKIIPFCGFDSIPADIGIYALQAFFRQQWNTELGSANGYYTLAGGGLNGGTLLSALNMMESGEARRMANPKLLLKDLKNNSFIPKIKRSWNSHFATDVNKWVYPFVMAEINTKVVYRSIGLAADLGLSSPDKFLYQEYHAIGKRVSATTASVGLAAFAVLGQFGPMRKLIRRMGPKSNEGPSEDQIENGFFRLKIFGEDTKGNKAKMTMQFQGDAGNKATVMFLCESALALVENTGELPDYNGFLTPAVALGELLQKRLEKAGLAIHCEAVK